MPFRKSREECNKNGKSADVNRKQYVSLSGTGCVSASGLPFEFSGRHAGELFEKLSEGAP